MQRCKHFDTCTITKCSKIHSEDWISRKASEKKLIICEMRCRCRKLEITKNGKLIKGSCDKYHPKSDLFFLKLKKEKEEQRNQEEKLAITTIYKMDIKNLEMIKIILNLERKIKEMVLKCEWIDFRTTFDDIKKISKKLNKIIKLKEELENAKKRQSLMQKEIVQLRNKILKPDLILMDESYLIQ